MNPLQVTELCEPDVMGLHRVRQDASIDHITDCGIVIGKADSMLRIILDHLEVNDFEQDRDRGSSPMSTNTPNGWTETTLPLTWLPRGKVF